MALIESTLNVNYKTLPFVATETESVIFHHAAQIEEPPFGLPIALYDSQNKKDLLANLINLAKLVESKISGVNVRVFKLKFLAPGRIDDIFKEVKRPITIAKYDVACMVVCESGDIAEKLKLDTNFQAIQQLFQQIPNHNIVTAKNIRKAGNAFVHQHQTHGVFLFNYFYVEDPTLDFLPVWEHTSRWFAEYTKLNNSYLLKPISGDEHFQYINHCYWPSMWDFVPQLIFNRSAKTYVLDNFSYNKAIAFPVIYTACY